MKKVYAHGPTWVIAETAAKAREVLWKQYGVAGRVKRVTEGFRLSFQGDPPFDVTEQEFVSKVDTFGGGIVSDDF